MPHQTIHPSRATHSRLTHKVTVPRRPAWGCREPFSYEAEANSTTYDVWFIGPDGKEWHGVQYGDLTQVCHCRRVGK